MLLALVMFAGCHRVEYRACVREIHFRPAYMSVQYMPIGKSMYPIFHNEPDCWYADTSYRRGLKEGWATIELSHDEYDTTALGDSMWIEVSEW